MSGRADKRRIILKSGGYAVSADSNLTQALMNLQMLIILAGAGFAPRETVVDVCRVRCGGTVRSKIIKACEEESRFIIADRSVRKSQNTLPEEKKTKPAETENEECSELVIASCGSGLFCLIDLKPEKFTLLKREEASAEVLGFWKKKKEAKK